MKEAIRDDSRASFLPPSNLFSSLPTRFFPLPLRFCEHGDIMCSTTVFLTMIIQRVSKEHFSLTRASLFRNHFAGGNESLRAVSLKNRSCCVSLPPPSHPISILFSRFRLLVARLILESNHLSLMQHGIVDAAIPG